MSKPRRPAPLRLPPLSAAVVRGPRERAGVRQWYWRIRNGQQPLWTGWASESEASLELARQLRQHLDPDPEFEADTADATVRTVLDLCEAYLAYLDEAGGRRLAAASIRNRNSSLRAVARLAGEVRLSRVRRSAVQHYVDVALGEYAPSTVEQHLKVWSCAWTWAHGLGLVSRDFPLVVVKVPKVHKRTPTLLEVRATFKELPALHPTWGPRTALILRLQLETGARLGEVLRADRGDFDAELEAWKVSRGKTGARLVPLSPELLDQVLGQPRTKRGLWGAQPHSASKQVYELLRQACEKAGVQRWKPHGLRRLAVDQLLRSGVDVASAAALLGHSPAVMLSKYRQVTDTDLRRAARALQPSRGEKVVAFPGSRED